MLSGFHDRGIHQPVALFRARQDPVKGRPVRRPGVLRTRRNSRTRGAQGDRRVSGALPQLQTRDCARKNAGGRALENVSEAAAAQAQDTIASGPAMPACREMSGAWVIATINRTGGGSFVWNAGTEKGLLRATRIRSSANRPYRCVRILVWHASQTAPAFRGFRFVRTRVSAGVFCVLLFR